MVVRKVMPASPSDTTIQVGDKIVALGPTPISSIGQYFKVISSEKPPSATLERPGTGQFTVAIDKLSDQTSHKPYASPLADGETFVIRQLNADGDPQLSGTIFFGSMYGNAMATLWDRMLYLIEIRLSLNVSDKCADCTMKNVALMDWGAKSWVHPASAAEVAWLIYPALNQPAPMVNVPPPTPIGAFAVSNTLGMFTAQQLGSYVYGNYSGQTVTTVVPRYDYTLTNVALMQNLASAIQADTIRQQNAHRQQFVGKRIGNFRLGSLNPGEKLVGYLFFAAPKNLVGPYLLVLDGGSADRVHYVRFDVSGPP